MSVTIDEDARRFTWDYWAGDLSAAPVTLTGHRSLSWAVDVISGTFGANWLVENALMSQTVPLMRPEWRPLKNRRTVVGVLELAARIELARQQPGLVALLEDARVIRPTRWAVIRDFQHLLLELEVTAHAVLTGWAARHEIALPSGRKPDLWLSRNGIEYVVEVTAMGFDREFLAAEAWTNGVFAALRALEDRHQITTASCADEILDDQATSQWLEDVEEAARLTSADGVSRKIRAGSNTVDIAPAGHLLEARWTGPLQTQDVWGRVGTRLKEKARQTQGGPPAWIRLDDVGALFRLTDWSARPLKVRLEQLARNVAISLAGAPHVHGVILSGAVQYAHADAVGETAWAQWGHLIGVPEQAPNRERLADGPAALRRILPFNRQRLTFVVPTRHDHILLPPGTGLEPGLWYHEESQWLDRALARLGQPPLAVVMDG